MLIPPAIVTTHMGSMAKLPCHSVTYHVLATVLRCVEESLHTMSTGFRNRVSQGYESLTV